MTRNHNHLDDLSLRDIFDLVLRARYWILMSASAAILGTVYHHITAPNYASSATIVVKKSDTSPLQAISERMSGVTRFDTPGMDEEMRKYVSYLNSNELMRVVARNLIDTAPVQTLHDIGVGRKSRWRIFLENIIGEDSKYEALPPDLKTDQVVQALKFHTAIDKPTPDSIKVIVKSDSVQSSVIVANAVAELGVEGITQRNISELDNAKVFLEEQLVELDRKIKSIQDSISDLQKKSNHQQAGYAGDNSTTLSSIKAELAEAKAELLQRQKLLQQMQYTAGSSPATEDYDRLNRIEGLRREQIYWKTRIDSLSSIHSELVRSKTSSSSIDQSIRNLERQANFEYEFYGRLKDQLLRIDVERISVMHKVRVGEMASLVNSQQSRNSPLKILLAAFLGAIATVVVVYMFEAINPLVHSRRDLKGIDIHFMGAIPRILPPVWVRIAKWRQYKKISQNDPFFAVVLKEPMIIGAIKVIRSKLAHKLRRDKDGKVVVVMSPNKGDGKTTVSKGLAVSFAQLGKKTLLIDCDLMKRELTWDCDNDDSKGVSDVVRDELEWEKTLTPLMDNLRFVPAGTPMPTDEELLTDSRFSAFIAEARKHYDVIIMDTPPFFASHDALIVSQTADMNLLVIAESKTKVGSVERVQEELQFCGVHNLAYIINQSRHQENFMYFYVPNKEREDEAVA